MIKKLLKFEKLQYKHELFNNKSSELTTNHELVFEHDSGEDDQSSSEDDQSSSEDDQSSSEDSQK